MDPGPPGVEVADYTHAPGVRGPDGEEVSGLVACFHWMSAQLLIKPEVAALIEQIDVVVTDQRRPVPHCHRLWRPCLPPGLRSQRVNPFLVSSAAVAVHDLEDPLQRNMHPLRPVV